MTRVPFTNRPGHRVLAARIDAAIVGLEEPTRIRARGTHVETE
jgi:hypothetical protein